MEKRGTKDCQVLSKHAERSAWKLPFQEVRKRETFRMSKHQKREKSLSVTLFPGTEREKERGDSSQLISHKGVPSNLNLVLA